jgi:hypothetical protein
VYIQYVTTAYTQQYDNMSWVSSRSDVYRPYLMCCRLCNHRSMIGVWRLLVQVVLRRDIALYCIASHHIVLYRVVSYRIVSPHLVLVASYRTSRSLFVAKLVLLDPMLHIIISSCHRFISHTKFIYSISYITRGQLSSILWSSRYKCLVVTHLVSA